jgi:membrane associated rhomboid family serine protease
MDKRNTNGSRSSGNGNDKEDSKIIRFPSLAERDRQRRKEEKQLKKKEKQWQKQYRKERHTSAQPFFNWGKVPPFSFALVISFVAIYILLEFLLPASLKVQAYFTFGFVPGHITGYFTGSMNEFSVFALVGVVTYAFLHGGFMHVLFNSVTCLALGTYVERIIGTKGTIKFFIVCSIVSALAFFAFNPFSSAPLVGASGGISGFFGAFLYNLPSQDRFRSSAIGGQNPWKLVLIWAGLMIVMALLLGDHSSWQAHVGGLMAGAWMIELIQKGKIRV